MKLLASDYDGTLNIDDVSFILKLNLIAINKFMENNRFMLNTGRSLESIKNEISRVQSKLKIDFNFDYLSCCDGNLILDRNYHIVSCTNLDKSIIDDINWLKNMYDIEVNPVIYKGIYLEYEIIVPFNNYTFNHDLQLLCMKHKLSFLKFYQPRFYKGHFVKAKYLYLGKSNVSKSSAVLEVSRLENIKRCDIFTIGDSINDVMMLRDFEGYTFPWAKKEVKDASKNTCLTVFQLVKKISK